MEVWLSRAFIAMATAARGQPAGCAAGSAAQAGPQTEQWYRYRLQTAPAGFPHTRFRSDSRLG